MVRKKVRRALSRVRGRSLRQRCASLLIATLIVSTAVVGALGPALGPASPTGEAEAVSLVPDSKKAALALGAYNPQIQTARSIGKLFGNQVDRSKIIAAEKNETKANIIQMWATQRQNNEVLMDSYLNYLEDTRSTATMIGMNEYVRQLNNGSAEATARNAAKQALLDYYARKEIQRNKQWAVSVESLKTAIQKAESSNISRKNFIYMETNLVSNGGFGIDTLHRAKVTDPSSTTTITLVNGTKRTIPAPTVKIWGTSGASNKVWAKAKIHPYNNFRVVDDFQYNTGQNDYEPAATVQIDSFKTKSIPSSTGARLIYAPDWAMQSQIETQVSQLEKRMDNIVNATYSSYRQGEINSSELISPLNYARSYSPQKDGKYGTYTLSKLAALGKSVPKNLGRFREMNLTVNGTDYQGVLLSDGLPPNGQYNVSQAYNTSNIAGEQMIQTDRGIVEIPENTTLRINSVVGTDGSPLNKSKVKYADTSYKTTDIKSYKQRMENLRETFAELNARQQNLTSSGSGGSGLLGGSGSGSLFAGFAGLLGLGLSGIKVALLIGGVVVLILVVGS